MKTTIDLPPILIDTREPDPRPWEKHFTVATVRRTLQTGDFSVPGCEHLVCVERKTVDDLIACLCGNRERFSKELARAAVIPHFWVVCEGTYGQLLAGEYRSQMTPHAAFQSVVALMTRYRIPFLMANNSAPRESSAVQASPQRIYIPLANLERPATRVLLRLG